MVGIDTSNGAGIEEAIMETLDRCGSYTIEDIASGVNAVRSPGSRWVTEGRIGRVLKSLVARDYVKRSPTWTKILFSPVTAEQKDDGYPITKWWQERNG